MQISLLYVIFLVLRHVIICVTHDDVIKWKHFPRNWPFVRGIHRSPVNSPHKGQWRGALMYSLICFWINDWVNNREAGDLRRYRAHYDVIVMCTSCGPGRCTCTCITCVSLVGTILINGAIDAVVCKLFIEQNNIVAPQHLRYKMVSYRSSKPIRCCRDLFAASRV